MFIKKQTIMKIKKYNEYINESFFENIKKKFVDYIKQLPKKILDDLSNSKNQNSNTQQLISRYVKSSNISLSEKDMELLQKTLEQTLKKGLN